MKLCGALFLCLCCFAGAGRAAQVNLATLTCVKYQNEVIAPPVPTPDDAPLPTKLLAIFGRRA